MQDSMYQAIATVYRLGFKRLATWLADTYYPETTSSICSFCDELWDTRHDELEWCPWDGSYWSGLDSWQGEWA